MAGLKRLGIGVWLAFAALQLPSCQFPNYNLLPPEGQGGSDGGAPSAGSSGTSATAGAAGASGAGGSNQPPLCDEGLSCQPAVPAGWLGPIAYWEGRSGDEPPDCPDGYSEPTDLHADPEGAPADCSCTCTPMNLKCGGTKEVTIYNNLNCDDDCATVGAQACTAASVAGCSGQELSIDAPRKAPTGTCSADVTPEFTSAGWKRDVRFCTLDADAALDECGDEQSCVPTPSGGFTTQLCVFRIVRAGQAAPECPDEYPNRELLYSSFEDERGCGECECEGPTGGSCDGEVIIASNPDCSTVSHRYVIGDPCQKISNPAYISVHYTMKAGSQCGVAIEPEPIGEVLPSGNYHAVCCQ